MTDINRRSALGAVGAGLGAMAMASEAIAQTPLADTLAKVKSAGTMLAGVRNDFPPIGSIDTDGKPVGFGPDLALAFGKKLGVKVEFVPTTSRTRIPILQNGSIDCEFGITTPTVERELTVDFTIPYVWDAGVADNQGRRQPESRRLCAAKKGCHHTGQLHHRAYEAGYRQP